MNLALQSISKLLTVTLLALEILLSLSSKNDLNTSLSSVKRTNFAKMKPEIIWLNGSYFYVIL